MKNRTKLSDAIDLYTAARVGAGMARNTVRNDKQHLTKLLTSTGNIWTHDLNPQHVDNLFATEATRLSDASLNVMHSSISAFIKWCQGRGFMSRDNDPLVGRRYRKVAPKDRLLIPPHQFAPLLDAADSHHARDRALIALNLYLMLRQSELADLRIGDVDMEAGRITVRVHKTKQVDDMPIPLELDVELRRWITRYQAAIGGRLLPEWYLLPSRTSHAMVRGWHGRFERAEDAAGLRPLRPVARPHDVVKRAVTGIGYTQVTHEGCHTLRRSGARALFDELSQNGYDGALRMVQTQLHHSSSVMTERYLGLTVDRRRRDTLLTGQPMFPSLHNEGTVVRLVKEG